MGFGFVVARFGLFLRELAAARGAGVPPPEGGRPVSLWVGVTLVVTGILVNLLATVDHGRVIRSLRRGTYPATKSAMGVALGALLASLGVVMAVYLLSVRGEYDAGSRSAARLSRCRTWRRAFVWW